VKGEVPVAFVVPDGEVTEAELKQFAIEHGPAAAHPRHVFFVEEYPLTGTEKVASPGTPGASRGLPGNLPEDPNDD